MKKLLIVMLVFGMASLANATVIDAVTVGDGNQGHAGTSLDPLVAGETIELALEMNWVPDSFPGGGFPSYDGYLLSAMDLTLTASGGGSMAWHQKKKGGDDPQWHANWSVTGTPTITSGLVLDTSPAASNFDNIGTTNGLLAGGSNQTLLWNFFWTCDGVTPFVNFTWGLAQVPGQYADYTGDGIVPDPRWNDITLGNLEGVTIHQVPEPTTIALLSFGGLLLARRRRK